MFLSSFAFTNSINFLENSCKYPSTILPGKSSKKTLMYLYRNLYKIFFRKHTRNSSVNPWRNLFRSSTKNPIRNSSRKPYRNSSGHYYRNSSKNLTGLLTRIYPDIPTGIVQKFFHKSILELLQKSIQKFLQEYIKNSSSNPLRNFF